MRHQHIPQRQIHRIDSERISISERERERDRINDGDDSEHADADADVNRGANRDADRDAHHDDRDDAARAVTVIEQHTVRLRPGPDCPRGCPADRPARSSGHHPGRQRARQLT